MSELNPCNSGKCKGARAGVKHNHDEQGRMFDENNQKFEVRGVLHNVVYT